MAKKLYGTDPDQVPTNADLGTIAYQDSANVVIDGGSARINAARPGSSNTARAELELYASGNAPTYIVNNSDRAAAGQHIAEFRGQWDGTTVARMVVAAGTDTTNKDDGVLSFWTASAGTVAKAAEFTSGGNLAFPSGQGIDFSSTGNGSGTMSSELLDDYEEGTWTPADGTAAGLTITINHASYTKIGRVVHVKAYILIPITTSGTNIRISGLPYTNVDASGWAPTLLTTNGSPGSTRFIRARANEAVLDVGTAEGDVSSTWSQYSNKWMIFSLVYSTS